MKRRLEKYREKSGMKTYTELLGEVRDFTVENLGKNFVIKRGCFEGLLLLWNCPISFRWVILGGIPKTGFACMTGCS